MPLPTSSTTKVVSPNTGQGRTRRTVLKPLVGTSPSLPPSLSSTLSPSAYFPSGSCRVQVEITFCLLPPSLPPSLPSFLLPSLPPSLIQHYLLPLRTDGVGNWKPFSLGGVSKGGCSGHRGKPQGVHALGWGGREGGREGGKEEEREGGNEGRKAIGVRVNG